MRRIFCLALSVAGFAVFASTAGASHLPPYPLPAAACNQGTEGAYEIVNANAYGRIPVAEGSGPCHHHHK